MFETFLTRVHRETYHEFTSIARRASRGNSAVAELFVIYVSFSGRHDIAQ